MAKPRRARQTREITLARSRTTQTQAPCASARRTSANRTKAEHVTRAHCAATRSATQTPPCHACLRRERERECHDGRPSGLLLALPAAQPRGPLRPDGAAGVAVAAARLGPPPPPISALGCGEGDAGRILDPLATPFQVLGLDASASYSAAQLKAAFRARVKEFHPDVCKDTQNADLIMRRVLKAYEMLSGNQGMMVERNNIDPFDEPECEARDIFVNELLCIGTGCPYSCVKRAPHAFAFADDIGTARAISQGNGDDYVVQLAVGQCPRKCIYYVTPCQRTLLEDVLASVLMTPYDLSEAAILDSLTSKAMFENNRYKKPKRETKSSSDYVDWM